MTHENLVKLAPTLFLVFSVFYAAKNLANAQENNPPLQIAQASISASNASIWDLSLQELSRKKVTSVATGTLAPVEKTASIVSVITADQINAMGATDLDEIIETIPGIHVNRSNQLNFPKYTIRGITSQFNPEVLLMFNGIPIKNTFVGNRSLVWAGMPVRSIERIEVIRGPGSALYGADAFSGVINVITKTASDIERSRVGLHGGSFNTRGGYLQHQFKLGALHSGLVFEHEQTDGFDAVIDADAQTLFDTLFDTDVSRTPGSINLARTSTELHADFRLDKFTYKLAYQHRDDVATGVGVGQTLDNEGRYESTRVLNDFTYKALSLTEDLDADIQLAYFYGTQEPKANNYLFQPGAILGGFFPEGVIGNPGYKEDQWRINLSINYSGIANHNLRLGLGGYWGDLYETTETKNFDAALAPLPGGLTDVSDTPDVFLGENSERARYAFLQDEWRMSSQVVLTSGLRYDHYSNFGETINPRIGLSWDFNDRLTTRILYGEAFRAPAFIELYAISNPVTLGNENLDPETIKTNEIAFTHRASDTFSHTLNVFYYEIDDFIDYQAVAGTPANRAQNIGRRKGHGFEWDGEFQASDALSLNANIAFQKSVERETKETLGNAPGEQAYLRAEWLIKQNWRFTAQVLWVGEQERQINDAREPTSAYTKIDLTLEANKLLDIVDLRLIAKNILDEDIREPSLGPSAGFPTAFIPNDLPQAGRWFLLEASVRW